MNARPAEQILAEIHALRATVLPMAVVRERLVAEIVSARRRFDTTVAGAGRLCAVTRDGRDLLGDAPHYDVARLALGAVLSIAGEQIADTIVAAAERIRHDNEIEEMPVELREEKLRLLRRELYLADLAHPERPGSNTGAWLGVPVEIAEQHNFFEGRES